jgi:type IV secretion system protein VirD4
MKKTLDIKKLVLLNMPYILLGLFATNLGEAWRMAQGADASEKFLSLVAVLPGALQSFWPSLHPLDLLVGLCCGGCLRLAVYLKSKLRNIDMDWNTVPPGGEPMRILHLTLILYFRTM